MRKKVTLITGAAGEIGLALIDQLSQSGQNDIVSIDLRPLPAEAQHATTHLVGDILDQKLFARLVTEYDFDTIFHLAALLSTRSEFAPELAHSVNVDGTLALLQLAADQTQRRGKPVTFVFPSSIAAYGLPDLKAKSQTSAVKEWQWNYPTTMYGCNKLYCELLGIYYSRHYLQLAASRPQMLDFRAVRFPGLISAFTAPSGGTTDYGPEMLHAAAQGQPYACFVREDTVLPFMAMPDAVSALLELAQTPAEQLGQHPVYNVSSFSLSAAAFRDRVCAAFPSAEITFVPDARRQGIVDSWPAALDTTAAEKEWGYRPRFDIDRAFDEYLIPNIRQRYRQ